MTFPPRWLRRILDGIDALQQRFKFSAFLVAVAKRHGDDRGGQYASLITFYGLLSVFPLLLLFITAASRILGPNSKATQNLIHSALSQFPVIGVTSKRIFTLWRTALLSPWSPLHSSCSGVPLGSPLPSKVQVTRPGGSLAIESPTSGSARVAVSSSSA